MGQLPQLPPHKHEPFFLSFTMLYTANISTAATARLIIIVPALFVIHSSIYTYPHALFLPRLNSINSIAAATTAAATSPGTLAVPEISAPT